MFLNEGNRFTHRYRPLTTQLLIKTLKYPLNQLATMCFRKMKKSKNRRNEEKKKEVKGNKDSCRLNNGLSKRHHILISRTFECYFRRQKKKRLLI